MNKDENLEFWKSRARPAFLWTTTINLTAITWVTLILVAIGTVKFPDAAGVLMAVIGAGGAGATVYQYGRTKEKVAGSATEVFGSDPSVMDPEPQPYKDGAF